MKTALLIVDYFGPWPEWIDVFLRSCAHNPSIDWLIHSDHPLPAQRPSNVRVVQLAFEEYCGQVCHRLDLDFSPFWREAGRPPVPLYTNLCDLRPCYADLHAEAVEGYDYFGWCDIDLVFGNLRRWLTPSVLEKDVVTFSGDLCSGHFTLLKNEPRVARLHRDIPGWRQRIQGRRGHTPWADCLDEAWMSRLCSPNPDFREQGLQAGIAPDVIDRHRRNNAFVREWVTPFIPWNWVNGERLHPEVWYWHDGALRNWRDGEREFPYMHFMNFKEHRYIDSPLYGLQATWNRPCRVDRAAAVSDVVRIDRAGIAGLTNEAAAADEQQLRKYQRLAQRMDISGMEPLQAMRALEPAGAHWRQDLLVDRAGVVPAALRQALWQQLRERGEPGV